MHGLTVSLLGQFHIYCNDRPLPALDRAKVQELFCYLLLFREKPHAREKLADTLWSGSAQSRKYLRKELWRLQTALEGEADLADKTILKVETDWIELDAEAPIWLDVAVLEESFKQVYGVPGRQLGEEAAALLRQVITLYRGDLLETCYADWCLLERERYRHMYLAILDKLMAYCEASGAYETGVTYGNLALRHDGARERTHRRLMRLYALGGYRTDALRQYRRCVQALEEELGVPPTGRTRALFERICAGTAGARPQPPTAAPPPSMAGGDILAQLRQAQELLHAVQLQLEQREAARARE